jgi:hypothetical protein
VRPHQRKSRVDAASGSSPPEAAAISNSACSAVVLGVHLRGMAVVLAGMQGMAVGDMRMVCGLFVISRLVMLGGFAMMSRRVLMMVRGHLMVFVNVVLAVHDCLPGSSFIMDAKHHRYR